MLVMYAPGREVSGTGGIAGLDTVFGSCQSRPDSSQFRNSDVRYQPGVGRGGHPQRCPRPPPQPRQSRRRRRRQWRMLAVHSCLRTIPRSAPSLFAAFRRNAATAAALKPEAPAHRRGQDSSEVSAQHWRFCTYRLRQDHYHGSGFILHWSYSHGQHRRPESRGALIFKNVFA